MEIYLDAIWSLNEYCLKWSIYGDICLLNSCCFQLEKYISIISVATATRITILIHSKRRVKLTCIPFSIDPKKTKEIVFAINIILCKWITHLY